MIYVSRLTSDGRYPPILQSPRAPSGHLLAITSIYIYTGIWTLPVSHYQIAPQKSLPGRQFTGENSPRRPVARAGRIFTGKLLAGKNFSGGGDPMMRRLLWGQWHFNKGRHIKSVIIFHWTDFSWGKHFSLTRAGRTDEHVKMHFHQR